MNLWFNYSAKSRIADGSKVVCFLVGLLLGQACSPLRNLEKNRLSSKTVSDSSLHADLMVNSEEKENSLYRVRSQDSLDEAYRIQIWPKGAFSYDPLHGFSGEAEKIQVHGRQMARRIRESADYRNSSRNAQVNTSLDVEQHSRFIEKQHSLKKAVSWKTVLGYLLVVFCLIASFLLFRGIRNKRFS